jgi:hypothetical protein
MNFFALHPETCLPEITMAATLQEGTAPKPVLVNA